MNFLFIKKHILVSLFIIALVPLMAQSIEIDASAGVTEDGAEAKISIKTGTGKTSKTDEKPAEPLPVAYRDISLGMPVDDVKKMLKADSIYGYRGERDVSLLPTQNRVLIESEGLSFLNRSWFQFYKDKLYTMTFKLDADRVDFYSVFKSLQDKYGEPTSLDPEKIVWKDDRVTLSLERPLVIKFIDTQVFAEIQNTSSRPKARGRSSDIPRTQGRTRSLRPARPQLPNRPARSSRSGRFLRQGRLSQLPLPCSCATPVLALKTKHRRAKQHPQPTRRLRDGSKISTAMPRCNVCNCRYTQRVSYAT